MQPILRFSRTWSAKLPSSSDRQPRDLLHVNQQSAVTIGYSTRRYFRKRFLRAAGRVIFFYLVCDVRLPLRDTPYRTSVNLQTSLMDDQNPFPVSFGTQKCYRDDGLLFAAA